MPVGWERDGVLGFAGFGTGRGLDVPCNYVGNFTRVSWIHCFVMAIGDLALRHAKAFRGASITLPWQAEHGGLAARGVKGSLVHIALRHLGDRTANHPLYGNKYRLTGLECRSQATPDPDPTSETAKHRLRGPHNPRSGSTDKNQQKKRPAEKGVDTNKKRKFQTVERPRLAALGQCL